MSEENPCLAFFEKHKDSGGNKVRALQQEPTALGWEKFPASCHSPGVVQPEESILRLAFQPLHIDPETRTLKPSAVSDVKDKGFSVDRLKYVSREGSIESGKAHAEKAMTLHGRTPRELRAVSTLEVAAVRSLMVNGLRAFGVYDTAQDDNMAHADVCQLVPEGQAGRSARSQLLELCDSCLDILPNGGC